MNSEKLWKIKSSQGISKALIEAAGSEVLAKILINRGIDSVVKIQDFLNPLNMKFTSPDVFTDMKKTVERVKKAVLNGENITVYGDFDADGITSTAVLYKTLQHVGAKVNYYLPDRETESHGLNTKALINIISKQKSKLIITVDCAISNVEEINFANSFKADVIITDHHEAPEILPEAFAILNPKAQNALKENLSIEEIQNLNYLAGVGVAFKLSCELLNEFALSDFIDELLPLVAIGTIADIVPLLGENRALVKMGLELIRENKNPGIKQLLADLGADISSVNSETISFMVAPRLNAAGRLDTAEKALKLLISDDIAEIKDAIVILTELNQQRQTLCDDIFKEAVAMIEKEPDNHKHSVILLNSNWHIGIIGIVASKLVEKYHLPVFLMTKEADTANEIRCSCRGIKGMNIHEILAAHAEYFIKFGGHSMAGGFCFDENVVSFEDFSPILRSAIDILYETADFSPVLEIDAEISSGDVDLELVEIIDKLQPLGALNYPPVFAIKNLILTQYKFMGQNSNHLKLYCSDESGKQFECIKWNTKNFDLPLSSKIDIAFYPKINQFNGNITLQLDLKDIKSEGFKKSSSKELKIMDHRKKTNILEQVVDYIVNSKKRISLFAESKKNEELLSKYEKIRKNIFNRESIPKDSEQIMFFDCPPDNELFARILSTTNADTIHLMNFDINEYTVEDFIKMLAGMLKYSHSAKNGDINIEQIAKLTDTTARIIQKTLQLLKDSNMIDFKPLDEFLFKVEFRSSVEMAILKQHFLYNQIYYDLEQIKEYRRKIHSGDIEELKNLIKN